VNSKKHNKKIITFKPYTHENSRFIYYPTTCSSVSTECSNSCGLLLLANGKKQAELKTALNNIVSPGLFLSYGSGVDYTWNGFFYTDRNASDSTVIDRYSNIVRKQSDYNGVSGMHIEHSLPKSW